jgi:chromosome segregation ATPase
MKTRIVYYIIGIVISALALTSVASLSSYAHNMNESLAAKQEQLNSLQHEYDQLKAEHNSLIADFDQTTSDLDQAKSDLSVANDKVAALEGELKTAQDQNTKLEQSMKIVRLNMKVLDGMFDDSVSLDEMDELIAATGNSEMSRRWDAVNDQDSLGGFVIYLVHTAWDSMN